MKIAPVSDMWPDFSEIITCGDSDFMVIITDVSVPEYTGQANAEFISLDVIIPRLNGDGDKPAYVTSKDEIYQSGKRYWRLESNTVGSVLVISHEELTEGVSPFIVGDPVGNFVQDASGSVSPIIYDREIISTEIARFIFGDVTEGTTTNLRGQWVKNHESSIGTPSGYRNESYFDPNGEQRILSQLDLWTYTSRTVFKAGTELRIRYGCNNPKDGQSSTRPVDVKYLIVPVTSSNVDGGSKKSPSRGVIDFSTVAVLDPQYGTTLSFTALKNGRLVIPYEYIKTGHVIGISINGSTVYDTNFNNSSNRFFVDKHPSVIGDASVNNYDICIEFLSGDVIAYYGTTASKLYYAYYR